MNPYILESIARYTVADRLREGDTARNVRAASGAAVRTARGTEGRARLPITHAVWHGCTPATHGGLTARH